MDLILVLSLVTAAVICVTLIMAILEQAYEETQNRRDREDPRHIMVRELSATMLRQPALLESSLRSATEPTTFTANNATLSSHEAAQPVKKFVGSRYVNQENRFSTKRSEAYARKGPAWMHTTG